MARTLFRGLQDRMPVARDFWSNERLGKKPRGIERTDRREYAALSMWETRELLEPWCMAFPQIGRYIAELEVPEDDLRFRMWPSGEPGHWSVQGEPEDFLPLIKGVSPVGGESSAEGVQ